MLEKPKVKTLGEKQAFRYKTVTAAFIALLLLPFVALIITALGFDPSPASGIVATACATLGGVVIGFFSTTPKDDSNV